MSSKMKTCQSCGMPMADPSQHACGDVDSPYCVYCTTPHGVLKAREQIRQQLVKFHMESLGMAREEAEKKTDEHMATMPAWQED